VRAAKPSEFSEIFRPIAESRHIAIAVSGGSDSMALLALAAEFILYRSLHINVTPAKAGGQLVSTKAESGVPAFAGMTDNRVQITVLTFDHGLRAESAAEAQWVNDWCSAHGIACSVLRWEGEKPATGIQAAARRARYDALTTEAQRIGADVLLTGHTANDQAETVVMRQTRTQSAASLAGIWPENEWNGFRIVRPLLGVTRDALRDFLRTRNISWLDDPSNANRKFERVRVRQSTNENDVAGLLGVADAARGAVRLAERQVAAFLAALTKNEFGVVRFARATFNALDALARHLALKQAFFVFGAGEAVSGAERDRLIGWLQNPKSKRRTLGGVVFAIAKDQVLMMREVARIVDLDVPEGGEIEWDRRFRLLVPDGAKIVPLGRSGRFKRDHRVPALVQQGFPCVLIGEKAIPVEFTCLRTLDFANEAPMLGSRKFALAALASREDIRL
jgi:tRNA(Ile)-lysidine synthase